MPTNSYLDTLREDAVLGRTSSRSCRRWYRRSKQRNEEVQEGCQEGEKTKALTKLQSGMYCALVASPPRSTFSRSRSSGLRGPRPLRFRRWPRGFPWLTPRALYRDQFHGVGDTRTIGHIESLFHPRASRRLGETENRCRPSIYLAADNYPRSGRAKRSLPRTNKVVGSLDWYRRDSGDRVADP